MRDQHGPHIGFEPAVQRYGHNADYKSAPQFA
jgi:hypothetical protein